jgi:hypothetical protein
VSATPAPEPTLDELLRKNPVADSLLAYLGRAKSLALAGEPWELAGGPVPALADAERQLRQALLDDLEITDEAVRLRTEIAGHRETILDLDDDVEQARRIACTVEQENAAALDLHRAIPFDSESVADDYVPGCLGCLAEWPCPTVRALRAGEPA